MWEETDNKWEPTLQKVMDLPSVRFHLWLTRDKRHHHHINIVLTMYVCLCLMMTLWITTSPSTSSPLPQPQPFFFSELTNLIRAKLGPKKAGPSRGANRIPGATLVTGVTGAGRAVGSGVSGLALLALSGIAGNRALGTLGPGGIGAGGDREVCAGSKLCVAASGQCCFLVINQRSLGGSPQCPPSCWYFYIII